MISNTNKCLSLKCHFRCTHIHALQVVVLMLWHHNFHVDECGPIMSSLTALALLVTVVYAILVSTLLYTFHTCCATCEQTCDLQPANSIKQQTMVHSCHMQAIEPQAANTAQPCACQYFECSFAGASSLLNQMRHAQLIAPTHSNLIRFSRVCSRVCFEETTFVRFGGNSDLPSTALRIEQRVRKPACVYTKQ